MCTTTSESTEVSELNAYYREVVRQMMYSNGDLEDPLKQCVQMVLNLVKFQMVKVLEDAWRHASASNRSLVTLEDVLFLFRRHKFLLKRLMHFVETAERINELKRAAPRTAKLDEERDQDSDSDDTDEITTNSASDLNLNRVKNYVDSLGLQENANQLLKVRDVEFEERQHRIAEIVMNDLTAEEYPRFTAARTATFLDDQKRTSKKKSGLLRWLGAPKCESAVAFVLAFIGREVVAYYVDAACSVMKAEEPNLFFNELEGGHIADDDENCPLQVRHYEEALRRCAGWRRRRDFLFGFYDDAEESDESATKPTEEGGNNDNINNPS